jgi:thioredoxin-like negative regulator of GroEL
MNTSGIDPSAALARAVVLYKDTGDVGALLAELERITEGADPLALAAAVEPYRDIVEVAGPVYERIVQARPDDAHALIVLANCYWLAGRGPEVVSELASRAMAADPEARGGWHLWALTEPDLRGRVGRWQQVVARFPTDDLARVNLADNAASLASTDHDEQALALAIATYRELRSTATHADQRAALDQAIGVLQGWRL